MIDLGTKVNVFDTNRAERSNIPKSGIALRASPEKPAEKRNFASAGAMCGHPNQKDTEARGGLATTAIFVTARAGQSPLSGVHLQRGEKC
jgi:hypothetical protein